MKRHSRLCYKFKKYNYIRKFSDTCPFKRFQDIPGPLSLPIFGTLYQYLPIIGKINVCMCENDINLISIMFQDTINLIIYTTMVLKNLKNLVRWCGKILYQV